MQRFFTIMLFYKPFIWWSFGINLLLGLWQFNLILAAVAKLFMLVFLWYYCHETHYKRRFVFFKNLGISTRRLFMTVYTVDLAGTLAFLLLFKEFN